jgi:hypothetical protein
MAKAKTAAKTAAPTNKKSTRSAPKAQRTGPTNQIEKPLPVEDQKKTIADERLESDQTMRVDGTTPRHTEPLGPPAPGQQGRPGPERRVRPDNARDNTTFVSDEELEEREAAKGAKMRVTATKTGYIHDVRRRRGDVFDIHQSEFSHKWMQRVSGAMPLKTTGAQAALEADRQGKLAQTIAKKQGTRSAATGDADVLD